jgi:uncharacterized damage-inducible protein DinB
MTTQTTTPELREQMARLIDWSEAHGDFAATVAGLTPAQRGLRPAGLPHSPWELLEHLRFTQHDILEFCRNPDYEEPSWPADYWPSSAAPPDENAWDASIAAFHRDRDALRALATDSAVDLFARIPHGTGQTYLRELLLVADHNSYHLGQIVTARRLLGAWPPA